MNKQCLLCKNTFYKKTNESLKYWETKRFCSIRCSKTGAKYSEESLIKKGESIRRFYINHPEARVKRSLFMKTHPNSGMIKQGQRLSPNTEFKKGITTDGNHPFWKGNDVGYYALHAWVVRKWGKADCCENDASHIGRRYEWSNISGKYKRERSNWEKLCQSCHRKADNWSEKMWKTRRERAAENNGIAKQAI